MRHPLTAARDRVSGSTRLRVVRLMWDVSPLTTVALGLFAVADGFLPNLAMVAMGASAGMIPAAVAHGLGSTPGRALLISLAVGTGAYALSLMRTPVQDLLSAHCSVVMTAGTQRRLAHAVCTPAGIEHLEDPTVQDLLASASGELSSTRPADAPVALAGAIGDRLGGLGACAVLTVFRWWVGLLFLAGWVLIRPPLLRLLTERATLMRRATPELRHGWYYLACAWRPQFAKEMRVFGLGGWVLNRHREQWMTGMAPSWETVRRLNRRVAAYGGLITIMYATGTGTLALAAYRHQASLGTLAIMLPMLVMTMQVGGVAAADVTLEQMLAGVPDLDRVVASLTARAPDPGGRLPVSGLPVSEIRLESVSYQYPHGDRPVLDGLNLELPMGKSLALVGVNGAGKTTLVTLLARMRDPTAGRVLVDGTDLRDLDPRDWQRQVAIVYQDFTRYPLTVRENIALADMGGRIDMAALERATEQAGARDVVDGLAKGWDSLCSPEYTGGVDLSGGQWQRIALARALYSVARGARVLVLDEPTAQLDVRAEALFYDRFLEMTAGVTTLIISHRFASVRRADRIAVLAGGRVTELGSHDELVATGGTYAHMFEIQASRFTAVAPGDGRG
jgi:ATP-binding cassette subfamily B protein